MVRHKDIQRFGLLRNDVVFEEHVFIRRALLVVRIVFWQQEGIGFYIVVVSELDEVVVAFASAGQQNP